MVRAISRNTGRSAVGLGVTLALGLLITHALVPPTPGPVAVAGILGVDLGIYMVWGLAVSIPMMLLSIIYIRKVGKEYYRVPSDDGWITSEADWANLEKVEEIDDSQLPGNFISFGPIFIPIALILANTLIGKGDSAFHTVISLLGNPVVAVGIGVIIALYGLTTHIDRKDMVGSMDDALSTTGLILVVTGCGGAMGAVLKASGAGPVAAEAIASSGIPALLVPLACAVGPVGFSHLNDSYFHIINRTLGVSDLPDQLKIWTVSSTIAWAIGSSLVLLLNLFFGKGGTVIDPIVPIAVLGIIVVWIKMKSKSSVAGQTVEN